MNVQFSLSASSVMRGQSRPDVTSGTEQVKSDSKAAVIRDAKEMSLKEKQGVNVSVAEEQLIRTIERAVKSLQGPQTTLEISIHEKTHDIMVKVLNKDTGELIREVPPEKTLDLVAKMMEIAGILIDEKI
ncbi:flagellar protein FlaG [Paenibacillus sp. G2S3]|uniref:flagellar protein FlaG n=1 Tax=Paenibacillus sp. G2S3 TaxID=3047872 RepID=UPI0024C175A6|nr:flagellar protein FlaG [Paenibacillus sp. G2S3]WHY19087.1 flagellar protein FlaG [Paenibacillus sp. G2S3]